MYDLERQNKILEILKEKKTISVDKLTKLIYASPATVRRDLTQMEKRGLVQRTYGGVILQEAPNEEASLLYRENINIREKRKICSLCSDLIEANSTMFLDSSTTVSFLIPFLRSDRRITVVTNGLNTAMLLSQQTSCQILLAPGYLNSRSAAVSGSLTINTLSKIHCKYAIISCTALNLEYGTMESTVDQAETKLKMIENCDKAILLCDSSKFDKNELFQIATLDKIDYIITDKQPDDKYKEYLEQHDVKLLY